MKLFGKEFKFNNFDIWHKGNFTPSKVATSNSYNDLDNKPVIYEGNTANTSGTNYNTFGKFASIRLTTRYHDRNALFFCQDYGHGGSTCFSGFLLFRVKQQNAMGDLPYCSISLFNTEGLDTDNFVAVISSNTTAETIVDLYYFNKRSYSNLKFFVIDNCGAGGVLSVFSGQALLQTLPEGVQFSCSISGRILRSQITDFPSSLPANGGNADTVDLLHATDFMRAISANGYYGLSNPGADSSNWIRTTVNGFIPYQSGGASSLGTSSWPFNNIYAKSIYENGALLSAKYAQISHTHTKSQITDMPTKLSQLENDIGAGGGVKITTAITAPTGTSPGDFWYKEI